MEQNTAAATIAKADAFAGQGDLPSARNVYETEIFTLQDLYSTLSDAEKPSVLTSLVTLWISYAQLNQSARQFKSALQIYESSLTCPVSGKQPRLHSALATFHSERNRPKEAQDVYIRAIEANVDVWDTFLVFMKEQQPNLTMEELKAAVADRVSGKDGGKGRPVGKDAEDPDADAPTSRVKKEREDDAGGTDDGGQPPLKKVKTEQAADNMDVETAPLAPPSAQAPAPAAVPPPPLPAALRSAANNNNANANTNANNPHIASAKRLLNHNGTSYPLRDATLQRYLFQDGGNAPVPPPPLFRAKYTGAGPPTFAAEEFLGVPLSLRLLKLCLSDPTALGVFECLREAEILKRTEYTAAREEVLRRHEEGAAALGRRLPAWESEVQRLDSIAAWQLRALREKQVAIVETLMP
eukprot:CAMPEP_0182480736 /NCGR_PEP_ID=MMETSP1319-20130603/36270_1 /TAXON_ID=172717 /ORGANISM="Bolidomonas pacifica, Strain RCC208" /LENGTH=410 /DNA_ID=CAMNT_0024682275 /DNA_START=347 /DNA_END=1575 /DNA_ORIENTATION=+